MTNEELAVLIQQGEEGYTAQLWEQVERFIEQRARRYVKNFIERDFDKEDLYQAGYFAMLEAVKYYSPEKGIKFLTILTKTLKKAFAVVAGIRSSRRDTTFYTISLDAPATNDEDATPLSDLVSDETAQVPFIEVELSDHISYTRRLITSSLERLLNDRERQLIRLVYLEGLSLTRAGELAGYTSKQAASQACQRAILRLRCSSAARGLRAALAELEEYNVMADAAMSTGLESFRRTGTSSPEGGAIIDLYGLFSPSDDT